METFQNVMPTLVVLDGHMVDHLIEMKDDEGFTRLGVDPECEYLGMNPSVWDALAQKVLAHSLAPTLRVGGSGANTARGFARLGGKACVYGDVGDDEAGSRVIAQLYADLCDVYVRTMSGATGKCLVFVRPNGKRTMRSDVGIVMNFDDENSIVSMLQPGTWLHLTGYLLDPSFPIHRVARAAMKAAAGNRVPISMDIGSGAYLGATVLREVVENNPTILFLNDTEAQQLGRELGRESIEAVAQELLAWTSHTHEDAIVVVTQGDRDVLVFRGNGNIRVPTEHVVVRDTTGAGDAFAAGFLYARMRGDSLQACARLGCQRAALSIQVLGGVPD